MKEKIKALEFCADFWNDIFAFIKDQTESEKTIGGSIGHVKHCVFYDNQDKYIEKYGDHFVRGLANWHFCTMCRECRVICDVCLLSNLWKRTVSSRNVGIAKCEFHGTPYRTICLMLTKYKYRHEDVIDSSDLAIIKDKVDMIVNECYIEIADLKGELPNE